MDIESELKEFKAIFDRELDGFLRAKIQSAEKISPLAGEMAENLRDYILRSGKRLRPALMYHTYLALGGKDKNEALKAAMAPEFIHTFLIIHDDIIDRDNLRRGKPSVHFFYCQAAQNKFNNFSDAVHYGNSQAICVGDMAFGMASEIIAGLRFKEEIKAKLLAKIGGTIFNTTIGQFHDIFAATDKNTAEKDVMIILEYKTARYTVEGPIHLGAIIAGADKKMMENLSAYAVPLGIAYQIQDDILGVFGSEEETGKPVGADIKEGKKTLLIVKASEFGSAKQKEEINSALGNPKLNESDVEKVRKIISETGSLEYSQNLAQKLVGQALQSLEKNCPNSESHKFFSEVADFIIKRNY